MMTSKFQKRIKKNKVCKNCGSGKDITIHHKNQKSKGGKNMTRNYQFLCEKCHQSIHGISSKTNKENK